MTQPKQPPPEATPSAAETAFGGWWANNSIAGLTRMAAVRHSFLAGYAWGSAAQARRAEEAERERDEARELDEKRLGLGLAEWPPQATCDSKVNGVFHLMHIWEDDSGDSNLCAGLPDMLEPLIAAKRRAEEAEQALREAQADLRALRATLEGVEDALAQGGPDAE